MKKSEIKRIISQLKKNEISVFDVPEEYENAIEIVSFERELGVRSIGRRGFDIISNAFFVEEEMVSTDSTGKDMKRNAFSSFEDFESYYNFLGGAIYDNACYTFCPVDNRINSSQKIDFEKLMRQKSFVQDTIDAYSLELSRDEKENYKKAKQVHKQCRQWIEKFNNCHSCDELVKVTSNYNKSKLSAIVDVTFFFFNYIFTDVGDKRRFSVIMEYMSLGLYPQRKIINALCSIYNPDDVMKYFHYSSGSKGTIYKNKKRLKEYISCLKNGEIKFHSRTFFDKKTHYFCEQINGYHKEEPYFPVVTVFRYFESFDEFVLYRKGDLRYCDLFGAIECNEDFSQYTVDKTTKLPLHKNIEVEYSLKKYYCDGKFYVTQQWSDKWGRIIKEYVHVFDYFFDFVAFLKGNLCGADLLFCDGLENLENWDFINFTSAKMKSVLCEKFGLQYNPYMVRKDLIKSFYYTGKNEFETASLLEISRDLVFEAAERDLTKIDLAFDHKCQSVCYISDIHLMHQVERKQCRSREDVEYLIQKIAETLADEAGRLLLIGGDVASDFDLFQIFVDRLFNALKRHTNVIFILGNHELWSFPGFTIDEIVSKYRDCLEKYDMYLLHNDLFYEEDRHIFGGSGSKDKLIKYSELCQMDETQIVDRLRSARYVILGGLGFSGYNEQFNAYNGIYRNIVDRETEIKESRIFENLYNRLRPILNDKNTIILTHTPKSDWCKEKLPEKNYIYVSGHTHKNSFHDDGEYRIYSDNQIGYYNNNSHLKSFLMDNDYDCFSDYGDGIFEITSEQYKDFYRGKNIMMTFQRKVNVLYMLKKRGYYCFIHKSESGVLTILHGGVMRRLEVRDIQYYYNNMETMISKIKTPLDKFTSFQRHIAGIVRKIGGDGTIHGSIIDVDFYNHIYVNPVDLTVIGYWASDIINKVVYPTISTLLEENCPTIFEKYIKLLKEDSENLLVVKQQSNIATLPQIYFDTDIYKASRELKKMQRLNSNILSVWYDIGSEEKRLE